MKENKYHSELYLASSTRKKDFYRYIDDFLKATFSILEKSLCNLSTEGYFFVIEFQVSPNQQLTIFIRDSNIYFEGPITLILELILLYQKILSFDISDLIVFDKNYNKVYSISNISTYDEIYNHFFDEMT